MKSTALNTGVDIKELLEESYNTFNDFFRLALRGSEIAETLTIFHRNRPCFKKMESLCARIKQDLIRADNILPNINSQGIAWAVKDLIFVFTRLINAWTIVKGYVYNTPEGLNTIKAALSSDFPENFVAWQSATTDFIDSLTRSFVNLDNLMQMRSTFQKAEVHGNLNGSSSNNNSLENPTANQGTTALLPNPNIPLESGAGEGGGDNVTEKNTTPTKEHSGIGGGGGNSYEAASNYHFTAVNSNAEKELQEAASTSGKYLKTGTYKPLQKETAVPDGHALLPTPTTPPTLPTVDGGVGSHHQIYNDDEFWSTVSTPFDGIQVPAEHQASGKLNAIVERIMSMSTADLLFKSNFTKNYVSILCK